MKNGRGVKRPPDIARSACPRPATRQADPPCPARGASPGTAGEPQGRGRPVPRRSRRHRRSSRRLRGRLRIAIPRVFLYDSDMILGRDGTAGKHGQAMIEYLVIAAMLISALGFGAYMLYALRVQASRVTGLAASEYP